MEETQSNLSHQRFVRFLWIVGLVLSILIAADVFLDQHETFYVTEREAQTAITAYYLAHESLNPFPYITPVVGYPWAAPFEFPTFQLLVAVAENSLISFETTGRLLSAALMLLSILVARRILATLGLSNFQLNCFTALAVTSPIFVSYGFSFTIESTALFFCLLYLLGFSEYMRSEKLLWFAFATLAGTIGAVSKTTTWLPTAAFISLIVTVSAWREFRSKSLSVKRLVVSGLILGIPLTVAYLWTGYTDAVKEQNAIPQGLTSTALSAWNYGTWTQKLSLVEWALFLARSWVLVLGVAGIVIPIVLLLPRFRARDDQSDRHLARLFLGSFFVGPVFFTNLYFEHDYYIIATALLLLFAVVALLGEHGLPRAILVIVLVGNLFTSYAYLKVKQANYDDPLNRHIVKAIDGLPEDASIVVFGAYLDSYIPYYSKTKALQTRIADFEDPSLQQALSQMKDQNVAAVISKQSRYERAASLVAQELGCDLEFELAQGVKLYGRSSLVADFRLERLSLDREVEERISSFREQYERSESRVTVSFDRTNGVSVLVWAGGNLYLFDLENGVQIVHRRWNPGRVGSPTLELN
jgi:hypothetical protein